MVKKNFENGETSLVDLEITSANSDPSPTSGDSGFQKSYSFCRYSTISGLVQFSAKTNLRRIMPLRSMMVVSG